jgi:hypothetical protein
LSWTATNQAMGHYLSGCANVVMTRTPRHALAALHRMQTGLLNHSADTFAEVARLWRKQNTELFVTRVEALALPRGQDGVRLR